MSDGPQRPHHPAPVGAQCNVHPERPAFASCPECAAHACLECWHPTVARCEACLARDPAACAPPIPWEAQDPEQGARPGVLRRLGDTLATAVRPIRTAPAFARAELGPAVRFALLVAVPMALLRGIIPYTHTLLFGPTFGLRTMGQPSSADMVLDILRAMGIGLGTTFAVWLAIALPYVSLTRAYGKRDIAGASALRVMLYRAWLVPLASQWLYMPGLLYGIVSWGLPTDPSEPLLFAVFMIDQILPLMVLLLAMRATARMCAGVGPFASYLVVLLPLVLLLVVEATVGSILEPWLPTSPEQLPSGG